MHGSRVPPNSLETLEAHTGHELSRSRAHQGDRATHDKGGHQGGHGKPPGPFDVQKSLKDLDYPASKPQVLDCARRAHVDEDMLLALGRIPERDYATPASISKELGKLM